MQDKNRMFDHKHKVITALFSGTGYDARCPGELISEMGNGLQRKDQHCFIFNGPGCENNHHLNTPIFWDPLPEINRAKKIFNLIRRTMDVIFGTSMEKIIDNAVDQISQTILTLLSLDDIVLNLGGWSRGAVAGAIVAMRLAKMFPKLKINLALVDPVYGPDNYTALKLPPQVDNLLVFYAQNETRPFMEPCNLIVEPATNISLIQTPGNHFSLVEPTYARSSYKEQNEPKVVWKLFISFFKVHGSLINSEKIQYYERVNETDLQISSFKSKSLNDYQTLDGLFAFENLNQNLNQRGKIRLTNNKYYCGSFKDELMKKFFPTINKYVHQTRPDLDEQEIIKELNILKNHKCWNILTRLKQLTEENSLKIFDQFFTLNQIPSESQRVEDHYKNLNNQRVKTMLLVNTLPQEIKRDPCTTFHRVWGKTSHLEWKDGFRKLAQYYCEQGIFTWRHHRDIFQELLKFLAGDEITPQQLLEQALLLINNKMQGTYQYIAKDGLLIQSLCYFRDRTKNIKRESTILVPANIKQQIA